MWKGNKTAHQFEALFEEAVTELELVGLGKSQRELLLGYLQKVGPQSASEIQKDVRTWTDAGGQAVARRVATWEEAHKVLVELDGDPSRWPRARSELQPGACCVWWQGRWA